MTAQPDTTAPGPRPSSGDAVSEARLSVVIPTRDRPAALARTLAALARQQAPPGGAEVIVVDDGSPGRGSARIAAAVSGPICVRHLQRPAAGPAAARNAGVAAARGELILFLGDDTEPLTGDLLLRHAELHAAHPEDSYVVQGHIAWHPRSEGDPLLSWLETSGTQFDFDSMEPGPVRAAFHLYGSHVSVKRSLLAHAGGFDARFRDAALEDTELGVRLEELGVHLEYRPELVVLHDHPTTLGQSLARQRRVGRAAATFGSIHPVRRHERVVPPVGARWAVLRAVAPAARLFASPRWPGGIRRSAWWMLHRAAYASGYKDRAEAATGS